MPSEERLSYPLEKRLPEKKNLSGTIRYFWKLKVIATTKLSKQGYVSE